MIKNRVAARLQWIFRDIARLGPGWQKYWSNMRTAKEIVHHLNYEPKQGQLIEDVVKEIQREALLHAAKLVEKNITKIKIWSDGYKMFVEDSVVHKVLIEEADKLK